MKDTTALRGSDVNILIVDDDDVEIEAVRRAFENSDIDRPLRFARDGKQALSELRQIGRWPTLVLLDLQMPGMDGLEFLKTVREDPSLAPTVVFVVTTSDDERDKAAAYEKHVAGFIVKSKLGVGCENLLELVREYCQSVDFPPEPGPGLR